MSETRRTAIWLSIATLVFGIILGSRFLFLPATAGGSVENIHACKILSISMLRIVDGPNDCIETVEEPISWRTGPEAGTEFPFHCPGCILYRDPTLAGRDLTNAFLRSTTINETSFANTTLTNAIMAGNAITNSDFTEANLTGVDLTGSLFTSPDFTGVNLTNADLEGAAGFSSATRTSIIWNNTICPDGTNSDSNGNTCEGHLTP
ncbi:hypothetical protein EDM68_05355 [Candidatus Uhrbacteria bacterium]|nr:MAG: hypothetical protein EDM68_05355 [Candidatus Uhrbacteria bacterium]